MPIGRICLRDSRAWPRPSWNTSLGDGTSGLHPAPPANPLQTCSFQTSSASPYSRKAQTAQTAYPADLPQILPALQPSSCGCARRVYLCPDSPCIHNSALRFRTRRFGWSANPRGVCGLSPKYCLPCTTRNRARQSFLKTAAAAPRCSHMPPCKSLARATRSTPRAASPQGGNPFSFQTAQRACRYRVSDFRGLRLTAQSRRICSLCAARP